MNPKSEHEELLNAVLLDPVWDEQVLGQVLQLAGRRRLTRRCQRAAGVAAVLTVLGWGALSSTRSRPDRGATPSALGTTRPTVIVATVPFRNSVPLATPVYGVIDDQELLTLAQGQAGMLVRDGPGEERLVFP